jgi:hypothetical protein
MGTQHSFGRRPRWAVFASALTLVSLAMTGSSRAAGARLSVATNGVDSVDCGPEGLLPCRSISRAIAHATAGDEIVVGPGVYGDINRNALVDPSGDSGEESPVLVTELVCPFLGSGVNLALIHINKTLTIVSRDGAASTVIDAGGQFLENYMAVDVAANSVVFGKPGKGFTIRNASVGVNVSPGIADAAVQGNVAHSYMGFIAGSCEQDGAMAVGTIFKGNTAAPDTVVGFYVFDDSAVVSGNMARANLLYGFAVLAGSDTVLTKNLAVDGLGMGFLLASGVATPPTFSRNAAIGNMDAGLVLVSPGLVATEVTIEKNSFFGNGKRPMYPPANCGLVVQNQGGQQLTVNADGNYWGAAGGPGGDPADTAGGTCVAGAVTMNLAESATREIRVKPPAK